MANPAAATAAPAWRAWLWWGLALIVAGLLLAAFAASRLLATVTSGETPAVLDAPVTVVDYYEPGTYVVYQSQDGTPRLRPDQVEVQGAVGVVPVTSGGFQETIEDGSGVWVSAAQFTIEQAGEYSVAVSAPDTQVRVATSLASRVGGSLAWAAVLGLGGLISLAGIVLGAVGLIRRSTKVGTTQPVAVSAPAGWYADPMQVGAQRYWDGSTWTDHTA